MYIFFSIIFFCVSTLCIVVQSYFSWKDGTFSNKQIKKTYPNHKYYLPFSYHFGMWSDLLFLTPIFSFSVFLYSQEWSLRKVLVYGGIGSILNIFLHIVYKQTPVPDSLVWKKGITRAGRVHFVYTGLILTVILLLLFATEYISFGFKYNPLYDCSTHNRFQQDFFGIF